MKKIAWILTAGFFLIACKDKTPKGEGPKNTDLIGQNLKGSVQHLEETPYKVDSTGKIGDVDSCCTNIQDFDEKGYNPKYSNKDNKGNIKEEGIFTRYEGGHMKEIVTMANGKKKSSISIQLDKDGKYSTAQSYDSTGKMDGYYLDLKENEYGQILSGKMYNTDSTLKYAFNNNFDKAIYVGGRTDSAGKMIYEGKAKVNDKGDQIEMINTNVTKDTTKTEKTTYTYETYDDQGNWTQRTSYDDKGKPTKIVKRTITYYKKG